MNTLVCLLLLDAAPPTPRDPTLPDAVITWLGAARPRVEHPAGEVALSPDGVAAVAAVAGKVVVIDERGRRSSPALAGPAWARLAIGPRGAALVGRAGPARLADGDGGRPVTLHEDDLHGAASASFSADGRLVALGAGRRFGASVRVWDVVARRLVFRAGLVEDHAAAALSPDGKTLAAWSPDGWRDLLLFDVASGKRFGELDSAWVVAAVFSPDGKRLAALRAVGGGQRLSTYTLPAGRRRLNEPLPGTWHAGPAFSPDGRDVAVGERGGTVHVFGDDPRTIRPASPVTLTALAWRADGQLVAAGWVGGEPRLWPVRDATPRDEGHKAPITTLAFSRDGRKLTTASREGAGTWDIATGHETHFTPHPHADDDGPHLAALSPGGRFLLAGRRLGQSLRLIDLARRETAGAITPDDRERPSPVASFTPDGRLVLTATPGERDGTVLTPRTLPGLEARLSVSVPHEVTGLAVSPDAKAAAIWDEHEVGDGRLRVRRREARHEWAVRVVSLADGKTLHTLDASTPDVAWSPDGKLAYLDARGPRLLDITRGTSRPLPACGPFAFSPCGRVLACGAGPVRVVETAKLTIRRTLAGTGPADVLAFSDDGGRLAAGGPSGAVVVWDLTGRDATREAAGDWWAALADPDGATAWHAMAGLISRPSEAVPLLRERTTPDAGSARLVRVVEVLERIATPAARRLLREWSVRPEARAASARLEAK